MADPGTTNTAGYGQQDWSDSHSDFAGVSFTAEQLINRLNTMKLVKVISVTGGGGAIAAAGTVSVQPLVSQIDGQGNAVPHGNVNNIPWWRLQGGNGAVIADPVVGDLGYVIVADRDTSSARANKGLASPGSFRQFDLADGVYVGGCLNGPPTQYLVFTSTGLQIVDLNGNNMIFGAGGIAVTTAAGGDFTVNGVSVTKHVHSGVQTGSGDTGPPV